jgi:hypothetical protein
MNPSTQKKAEYQHKRTQHFVSRFYALLSVAAVLIMISAAYATYGYQVREVLITLDSSEKDSVYETMPSVTVNADLSRVPSDKELKKMLNDIVPHMCDDCDDDVLECLDEYTMDKVLVRSTDRHQLLYVNILTGKEPKKYSVVLDLDMNNALVKKEGSIDKKECISAVDEEEVDPNDMNISVGEDPGSTQFITTKAR